MNNILRIASENGDVEIHEDEQASFTDVQAIHVSLAGSPFWGETFLRMREQRCGRAVHSSATYTGKLGKHHHDPNVDELGIEVAVWGHHGHVAFCASGDQRAHSRSQRHPRSSLG